MLALGLLGGSFLEPNPLDYFFGAGIGVNIGASLVWGFIGGLIAYVVARHVKRAWAGLHARIDELHARHDEHAEGLRALREKLDKLLD
jgi:hypothetical protein